MGTYDYSRQEKQPSETITYDIVFASMAAAESITSVDLMTFSPVGIDILSIAFEGNTAQVQVSGGVDGSTYTGRCRVTTDFGNVFEGDFKLIVRER